MTKNEYLKRASMAYFEDRITMEVYDILVENADIFTTDEEEARIEARHRTFQGFGEEHTNAEWARLLGLPRNTLLRYLRKGLTVEEVAEKRGVKYPA